MSHESRRWTKPKNARTCKIAMDGKRFQCPHSGKLYAISDKGQIVRVTK